MSPGTYANWANLHTYEEVDALRIEFVAFCEANILSGKYQNGIQAWNAFWSARQEA